MQDDNKKAYKLEVRVTLLCFIIVAVIGGFFSSIIVILQGLGNVFFREVPVPPGLPAHLPDYPTFFVLREGMTVMGFPLHYFLLIMLSWIGVTLVGAIWCLVMDRLEEKQRA